MLKSAISNNNVTVLKMRGKRALADVNCYCKMTSVIALDGETSFYACETLQIYVKVCDTVQVLARYLQCNCGKLEEAEDFKCNVVRRLLCVRIEIDLVRE